MSTPNPSGSKELQPKVVQKLVFRTLIFVLVLGALFFGIRWYRENRQDLHGNETADTIGWIGAIEYKADGQEAVAIKPDLTIERAAGWHSGATDRDIVWDPAGNFLFFISDRQLNSFHVYRWNPTSSEPEIRTVGNRGRSSPAFPVHPAAGSQKMLITSGGLVMEFDPRERLQTQILPPVGREITVGGDDQGAAGAQGEFTATYGNIGNSFRVARYCGNDDYIAAVMRRDEGEVLVVQNLAQKGDQIQPPATVAAGEHIDIDVNPQNGHVVFSVNRFQWPTDQPPKDFVKNGKVTVPFQHYIAELDPANPRPHLIVQTPNDNAAFGSVAVSPTGSTLVVVAGPYKDGAIEHRALVTFPVAENGARQSKAIVVGEVYEPSWDAKGENLVYAKRDDAGKRTIFTAKADGSSERNITGGKGDFGFPKFSPQTAGG